MESFGVIEAVKTVADLFTPVSGKIIDVNNSLIDQPDLINSDPYGKGWIIKIEMNNKEELDNLLDVAGYKNLLAS